MITLRHLRYLEALAETGHFGRAAEIAGISQPALSMQIRELERQLGGALFERRPGGLVITQLGEQVRARGAGILAAVRDLEDTAAAREGVLCGPLRIGIIPSLAPYLLPELVSLAAEHYPRLKPTIRETVTRTLTAELLTGGLDVIIASLPLGVGEIEERAAFEDRFLLAAPVGSMHAKLKRASVERIAGEELLLLEDGHCLRDQALAICGSAAPQHLRSFGATSLATILHLVAAGQGVTLLPEIAADTVRSDRRIRLVRFARPEPRRTAGIAWRRSSPRAADFEALAELVAQAGKTVIGRAESHANKPQNP
ncbi:MAG TPA: hydrogen peroxide-inducible genes activator [Bauldia sp.]|nr:hydrogen peroxide-inducible genes activator [Bauldia sp.]